MQVQNNYGLNIKHQCLHFPLNNAGLLLQQNPSLIPLTYGLAYYL